jgi:peptide/nickel transport system permease protein
VRLPAPAFGPLPIRLLVGSLALGALAVLCVVGSWFAADPTEITDPRVAALLPPGTQRWVIELTDGTRLVAEAARREEDRWVILRRGQDQTRAAAEVRSLELRTFWLGTDTLGRDVLARILYGGRVSLAVGSASLVVALVLGIGVGMLAGWRSGWVDTVLMRLVDGLLAIPMLFLLLLLAAVFRPSLSALVAVLAFSSWMGVARLVRGQVLSLKEREFILGARAIGAGPWRIATRHLLPNTLTPLSQDAALRLGDLILAEASLSFLGLGVQPPVPSWGNMVAEGQTMLLDAWWLALVPGAAVALTVIAAALVADGIREVARQRDRAAAGL